MALGVMARAWPLRPRSLHADPCAGERVMGVNQNVSGLGVMARAWPSRSRSLHVDCCDCERVMGVNQNVSGLSRDGRSLAIAAKVLTRRFLGWRTRYRKQNKTPKLPKREYLCPCCDFPQIYHINHRLQPLYPQPPHLSP